MNLRDVVSRLGMIVSCEGSDRFFCDVGTFNSGFKLEEWPNHYGFKLVFPNGDWVGLHKFQGTIFGCFRDKYGTSQSMVYNQNTGHALWSEVVDHLILTEPLPTSASSATSPSEKPTDSVGGLSLYFIDKLLTKLKDFIY
ncbi:hypothetical protein KW782_04350 [Candidatus Parcubacteria bacterium]|nr:hypothetical protein [Candidatus Parcubacteria bacterium]